MKKNILMLSAAAIMIAAFASCGKKTNCVCEIDEFDLSAQNGATRKVSCDGMKATINMSGTGTCKLK
jgi:hypothetical protein